MKHELERIEIPGEHDARVRTWEVVRRAFAEREREPRRVPVRALMAAAAAAVAVAAVASPPGRALLDSVREAVGVEQAEPALFRLPAGGRVLAQSPAGAWVVARDGSRRFLGPWSESSWSPNGLFVVVARENELAALEPDGDVRWKLARRNVRFPRWGGTRTDTRIAYLAGSRLHVVAGDGTGDVDAGAAARVAPAWLPGARHVLAYVTTRGSVRVLATDAGMLVWRLARFARPRALAWSPDGSLLVLATADRVVFFRPPSPRPVRDVRVRGVLALAPFGDRVALLRARDVLVLSPGRAPQRVFAGAGRFDSLAWSPNGRWLAVGWRDADQWVFVRTNGTRKLSAVSNVAEQFDGYAQLTGWCCA